MDVGGSVSLGGGRSLFLFGDTFLGGWNPNGTRNVTGAVHSSTAVVDDAALARCFAGASFGMAGGAVAPLLQPADAGDSMVWPLGPALVDGGELDLLYTWVRHDPAAGFGFSTLGNGIAAGPVGGATWSVAGQALSARATEVMPSAWLVHDGYAYLYRCGSQLDAGWDPCIVGRAPLEQRADLGAYRYYVGDGGYAGTYAQAAVVVEGAPAFTVTWNAFLGAYLEVYVEPFATAVSARRAAQPEGPFSQKVPLWPCSLPADDPQSFCYAAFEHPQYDSPDGRKIVLTYDTNTNDFASMLRHPNLYWPRLVTLDLSDAGL
jgi:hypothetical protein